MENGTWEDHGSTGVESSSADSYNAIDPTMILVDGTYHLSFGSYWGDIQLVTFNSDATAADGDPSQTIYKPSGSHDVEASFPFQYGDYFYIFWSEGQANDYDVSRPAAGGEYRVRACRSSDIGGPYTDGNGTSCLEGGGNDVLASHDDVYGPGGQGILDDPTYGPILYYRYGESAPFPWLLDVRLLMPIVQSTRQLAMLSVITNGDGMLLTGLTAGQQYEAGEKVG